MLHFQDCLPFSAWIHSPKRALDDDEFSPPPSSGPHQSPASVMNHPVENKIQTRCSSFSTAPFPSESLSWNKLDGESGNDRARTAYMPESAPMRIPRCQVALRRAEEEGLQEMFYESRTMDLFETMKNHRARQCKPRMPSSASSQSFRHSLSSPRRDAHHENGAAVFDDMQFQHGWRVENEGTPVVFVTVPSGCAFEPLSGIPSQISSGVFHFQSQREGLAACPPTCPECHQDHWPH